MRRTYCDEKAPVEVSRGLSKLGREPDGLGTVE